MRTLVALLPALALAGPGLPAQTVPDRTALEARLAELPLPADALPPLVAAALIAGADRDYRSRYAADDATIIARSVVRMLLGDRPPPTPEEGVAEVRALPARVSAEEMLALYANLTFFGRDAFGIEAGARAWFGKPAGALAPEETAFLAALVPAPLRLARPDQAEQLKARRDMVLEEMFEAGAIDAKALARGRAMPLP